MEQNASPGTTIQSALMELPVETLKEIVNLKIKLSELESRRSNLETELEKIDAQMKALASGSQVITEKKKQRKAPEKRPEKTIPAVVLRVMKDAKRPLTLQEISDTILTKKLYPTKSKNFPAQLGVLIYSDHSELFKKVKRGKFVPAAKAA